jgi:segregation and condensation protein A
MFLDDFEIFLNDGSRRPDSRSFWLMAFDTLRQIGQAPSFRRRGAGFRVATGRRACLGNAVMDNAEVKFRLDVFEGPLDLLLHLIKTNELEISEISLSKITSQYLEYTRLMEAMDLEVAGDYLVMAATLINIKLRALLPSPEDEVEPEGEQDLDDFMSAKLLLARLIEYRKFKEASQRLGERAERQAQIFMREVALPRMAQAEEDVVLHGELDLLLSAFARVIRFVDRRDYHQVQAEEFSIEDKIAFLRRRLVVEDRIELTALFQACQAKVEAIALLIAVLELCRLKELRVIQGDNFDHVLLVARRVADEQERAAAMDEQAREAKALEADILANRTGVVDDGVLPDEEEADAASPAEAEAPAEVEVPAEAETPATDGARVIDLSSEIADGWPEENAR